MSEGSELRKKRCMGSDTEAEKGGSLYADAETMARRRVVRVLRQTPNSSTAPSVGEAFKSLSKAPLPGAQALPTQFSFGAAGTTNAGGGAASQPQFFFTGGNTADSNTTAGKFFFGTNAECKTDDKISVNNAFTGGKTGDSNTTAGKFFFGTNAECKTDDKISVNNVFTGGKTGDSNTTAGKFFFGTNAECKTDDKISVNNVESGKNSAGAGTSLFGEAFKFTNSGVNLFADAKERLVHKDGGPNKEQEGAKETRPQEEPVATDALKNAEPAASSTSDLLASVPCKLFLFKTETKTWVECGVGDAKIKRHQLPTADKSETKIFYRLTVRDGYSLVALLCSNFCLINAEDTHIVFSLPKEGNEIATYFLRYTGQQKASCGAEFTKVLKESLRLAIGEKSL